MRTQVLALERKLGCRFPVDHPILAWVVEACADMLTKYGRGNDGRTHYERLVDKPIKEEGLELGECVLFRPPRATA